MTRQWLPIKEAAHYLKSPPTLRLRINNLESLFDPKEDISCHKKSIS